MPTSDLAEAIHALQATLAGLTSTRSGPVLSGPRSPTTSPRRKKGRTHNYSHRMTNPPINPPPRFVQHFPPLLPSTTSGLPNVEQAFQDSTGSAIPIHFTSINLGYGRQRERVPR